MLSYAGIFYLPYAADTPSFNRVVAAARGLTFAPLILQSLAPVSWGLVHPHPEKANSAFTDLFRLMSFLSLVLHGTATFNGLRYNLPDSHYHRHSKLLPWDVEERSKWERARTASGKLLGSMADHPVVAAVGYDVLLSGLSLGVWAAVRSLRASHVLTSAVPLYESSDEIQRGHASEEKATEDDDDKASTAGSVRRSSRQHKARVPSVSSVASRDSEDNRGAPAPRRRGRPRKVKPDPEEELGDATYEPSAEEVKASAEGDSLPSQDVDWEAAALAWGLTAVGGLGLGSSGVFGGECLAR